MSNEEKKKVDSDSTSITSEEEESDDEDLHEVLGRSDKQNKKKEVPFTDINVEKSRDLWREKNEFKLIQTRQRNVVLCGRSRCGKTTAMKILRDVCHEVDVVDDIFADTYEAKYFSFAIQDESGSSFQDFTINLIDTPGFFEVHKDGIRDRPNEEIELCVRNCLETEITHVNCVLIFASSEGGLTQDDYDAIDLVLKMFKGGGIKKALVFTRMDEKGEKGKRKLVKQLQEQKDLMKYLQYESPKPTSFCKVRKGGNIMEKIYHDAKLEEKESLLNEERKAKGIEVDESSEKIAAEIEKKFNDENLFVLFTGAVQPRKFGSTKALYSEYKHISRMRKMLLEFIFSSWRRADLTALPVYTKIRKEFNQKAKLGIEFMKKVEPYLMSEFDNENFRRDLKIHEEVVDFLQTNAVLAKFEDEEKGMRKSLAIAKAQFYVKRKQEFELAKKDILMIKLISPYTVEQIGKIIKKYDLSGLYKKSKEENTLFKKKIVEEKKLLNTTLGEKEKRILLLENTLLKKISEVKTFTEEKKLLNTTLGEKEKRILLLENALRKKINEVKALSEKDRFQTMRIKEKEGKIEQMKGEYKEMDNTYQNSVNSLKKMNGVLSEKIVEEKKLLNTTLGEKEKRIKLLLENALRKKISELNSLKKMNGVLSEKIEGIVIQLDSVCKSKKDLEKTMRSATTTVERILMRGGREGVGSGGVGGGNSDILNLLSELEGMVTMFSSQRKRSLDSYAEKLNRINLPFQQQMGSVIEEIEKLNRVTLPFQQQLRSVIEEIDKESERVVWRKKEEEESGGMMVQSSTKKGGMKKATGLGGEHGEKGVIRKEVSENSSSGSRFPATKKNTGTKKKNVFSRTGKRKVNDEAVFPLRTPPSFIKIYSNRYEYIEAVEVERGKIWDVKIRIKGVMNKPPKECWVRICINEGKYVPYKKNKK